jgi:hypothetical protein
VQFLQKTNLMGGPVQIKFDPDPGSVIDPFIAWMSAMMKRKPPRGRVQKGVRRASLIELGGRGADPALVPTRGFFAAFPSRLATGHHERKCFA